MARVTYKNYIMDLSDHCEDKFDLKVKTGVFRKRKGEDEEKEVLKVIGYAMNLAGCINKIVHLELFSEQEEYELRGMVDSYKKKYDEIKELLTA